MEVQISNPPTNIHKQPPKSNPRCSFPCLEPAFPCHIGFENPDCQSHKNFEIAQARLSITPSNSPVPSQMPVPFTSSLRPSTESFCVSRRRHRLSRRTKSNAVRCHALQARSPPQPTPEQSFGVVFLQPTLIRRYRQFRHNLRRRPRCCAVARRARTDRRSGHDDFDSEQVIVAREEKPML